MEFHSVPEALAELKRGRSIVVVDDKDRENEGDVIFAASKSTPAKINFLAKHARGLICVALSAERADRLRLRPMAEQNRSRHDTAFTVSVEAREGTTTGISAADRSVTAQFLADERKGSEDFVSPGHVFPIRARSGGVLVRAGHTEAAVDLVRMAGLGQAGVICEIMNEDGTMARLPDCLRFARKHKLKILSVEDLILYRRQREKLVRQTGTFPLSTHHGEFQAHVYEDVIHGRKHMALVKGTVSATKAVPVRVHSECLFGDTFGSARCDCGDLLQRGMRLISRDGGVFLYMRQVNPEDDLGRKADALTTGNSAVNPKSARSHHGASMDARTYGIGAQILFDLGVRRLNLLTSRPKRIGLEGYGLRVSKQTQFPAPTGKSRRKEKA